MANLRVNKITSTETFEKTGSVQFDGTGDYLEIDRGSDTTFALGTDDFTIEMWVYRISNGAIISTADNGAYDRGAFALEETGNFVISQASGSVFQTFTAAVDTSVVNTWVHYAFVRKDNVVSCYEDGKLRVRQPTTINITYSDTNDLAIGARRTGGGGALRSYSNFFEGHISNVRIIKGKALYTANFKPPMRELEVTPETVLLACQSKTDATLEKTGKTITVNGNAVASELTPGILTPVPKAGAGSAITGSVEFDGSGPTAGGYLELAKAPFQFLHKGTDSYTVEAWVHKQATTQGTIFDTGGTSATTIGTVLFGDSGGVLKFRTRQALSALDASITTGDVMANDMWHHVALTYDKSTFRLFVNGILVGSTSYSTESSTDSTQSLKIGAYEYSTDTKDGYFNGFISNLRIVRGTALYTDDFIPPTRELKKVPGTVLLCCQDENSVTTEATGKTITSNGDPAASNFTPQVGDDKSIILDGVTNMNTENYFYLPTGDTESRYPIGANTIGNGRAVFSSGTTPSSTNTVDYITISSKGDAQDFGGMGQNQGAVGTVSDSTRGIFAGGQNPVDNRIEYITISSSGDTKDFGDMTRANRFVAGAGNALRGCLGGGLNSTNTIDYITIQSMGNAFDFGDLVSARGQCSGLASPTRGIFAGGHAHPSPSNSVQVIDFISIMSTGNAQDFGDLINNNSEDQAGASNEVRGLFAGGSPAGNANQEVIQFITIASTGDATDFGNLVVGATSKGGAASPTRAVFAGGYTNPGTTMTDAMDFVTITSTGNAQDFGDLTVARDQLNGVSNSHGGLG